MKKIFSALALLALLNLTLIGTLLVKPAEANPEGSFPNLSMPVEYVNYTIVKINGSMWAKVDGYYPIYVLKQADCIFNGELPMVYPMPPDTTNVHVTMDDTELGWVNFTESNPDMLHHTAIGDWWMIYTVLENVSDFFVLKIHYEHPIEVVNGSYLFLYDLNISPYLSVQSNNSTVYFTIRMQTNTASLNAYTAETDTKWNPINYTSTTEGTTTTFAIQMHSEYEMPLLGDLVVMFNNANQAPEFPLCMLPILIVIVSLATILYKKRKGAMISQRE